MEYRETITLRNKNNQPVTINARCISIQGFEEYKFFVHTSINENPEWVVTEASSSTIVGTGLKWFDAVAEAEFKILQMSKEQFLDFIKQPV